MASRELAGQVAVVTGGGRGFGRAIAVALAEAGAAVGVTARTLAQLDETVDAIKNVGGSALAIRGDVRVRHDVEVARREIEDAFGPVTLAVSNAGVSWPFGPLSVADPDRWWEAHAIHLRGALNCITTFVPGMIERREGRVIVVSSGSATRIRPNHSGYSVPKNAQNRLVEHLAEEARSHDVFAWSITPGEVVTELAETTMGDPDAQKTSPTS